MDWLAISLVVVWMIIVICKLSDIARNTRDVRIFCQAYSIRVDDMYRSIEGINEKIESLPYHVSEEIKKINLELSSIESKLTSSEYTLEAIRREAESIKFNTKNKIHDDF